MTPTIVFSQSDDAARVEVRRSALDPILACVLERYWPVSRNLAECLMFFIQTDTLFLSEETMDVFSAIEDVCQRITAGEISGFSPRIVATAGFEGYIDLAPGSDGTLSAETRFAARDIANAFALLSRYWPPGASENGRDS